jgi:acetolactate synthase-1/2/3 large subunit
MVCADVGWLHEVKNQQAALDAVCDRSIRVEQADDIPEVVATIFERFGTGRPRPVHLEVPVDVLEDEWTRRPAPVRSVPGPVRPGAAAIEAIAVAVAAAKRPVVLVGGGARRATGGVRTLADYGIPVLTTVNGKGELDERHPAALGAALRLQAARDVADRADVLLILGSEAGDADLWGGTLRPGVPGQRTVIRIDIDPAQMHKNVPADLAVVGDASAVLGDLLEVLRDKGFGSRPSEALRTHREAIAAEADRDAEPWAPIQRALAAALPDDTVVAGDSSQVTYYGTVHHWPFTPANRLLYPTGFATLGYGLPAAIGAKVAAPARPVIGLFGDGAAMFSIQELITATELRLALPIVIVDNGGYAEIRQQMVERDILPQAVDLYRPDIPGLARAIGAHGLAAATVDDIAEMASQALLADRPTVILYEVG